ncbi:hypothetical protein CFC21_026426 [Triticum aestivum]|uniref:rRNA N-glycosidase n=2 Tax=Triticum aestivum TaxID=4565 RepID=A0A3B6CGA9_WHEAT|nr:uncharacterized protein LOC123042687 [Triticum aestivum]KAF7012211.1 hypothetical protein CFC21_026426 [Triticum aestivum]
MNCRRELLPRAEFMQFLKRLLNGYRDVSSLDIQGLGYVTPPPTFPAKYLIVDITRPSGEQALPRSIMQFLVRLSDNYTVGLRNTPEDPYSRGGWFLFNNKDIIDGFPDFMGDFDIMNKDCGYFHFEDICVREKIISVIVAALSGITEFNCKYLPDDTKAKIEAKLVLIGECPRLHVPLQYTMEIFESLGFSFLPAEELFHMRHWSFLCKATFALYLAILEAEKGVSSKKESFINARRLLVATVQKFSDQGHMLNLKSADGFFSLRRLAGGLVRLFKYNKVWVQKLITRKSLDYKASFKHVKHDEKEFKELLVGEPDIISEQAEYNHWMKLLSRDELLSTLMQYDGVDDPVEGPWRGCYTALLAAEVEEVEEVEDEDEEEEEDDEEDDDDEA